MRPSERLFQESFGLHTPVKTVAEAKGHQAPMWKHRLPLKESEASFLRVILYLRVLEGVWEPGMSSTGMCKACVSIKRSKGFTMLRPGFRPCCLSRIQPQASQFLTSHSLPLWGGAFKSPGEQTGPPLPRLLPSPVDQPIIPL